MAIKPEHIPHLENLHSGLMRRHTPDHIADELVQAGLARHAVGGLMMTEEGLKALYGK